MNSDAEGAAKEPIADSKVGYCHPPESTRFTKGQSGNPKGRPKGTRNVATILAAALRERVVINENGQRKTISKLDAGVKQLVNKAASGDLRALQSLLALLREGEDRDNTAAARTPAMGEADQTVMEGILKRFQRFQGEKEVESEADPE